MTTHRAVRFRLYPGTRAKHQMLYRTAGACRFVWNHFLARTRREYRRHLAMQAAGFKYPKPSVSFFSLGKEFAALRKTIPWMQELPFGTVRYTLKRQADAWQRAFRYGGFPKFHGKGCGASFTVPDGASFTITHGRIRLPRIGWLKLSRRGGNPHAGCKPVMVTVKCELGNWYATVVYEAGAHPAADDGRVLGVDMNCGQVADSDGGIHRLSLDRLQRLEARKRRYQRMVARRRKGSNRRALARHRLAKACCRIADIRHDWHHRTSKALAAKAGTIAVEALNIKGMTASGTGGRKRGLNRSILNTGWGGLHRMLEYKAAHLVTVDPAYTSQTCHECGHVEKANRETQSRFVCQSCGWQGNADTNAALNILALGIGASGRGDGGGSRSVKRQQVGGTCLAGFAT